MDDILRQSTTDSCTEKFTAMSYQFQIENYDLKKALCALPLYQNLMIKKIVDYTNGINFIDESIDASEVDILRGFSFNYSIANNPTRKLSGIVHDFNYQDPRFERKSMGRYTSKIDKETALNRFNAICRHLNVVNAKTYKLYKKQSVESADIDSELQHYEAISLSNTNIATLMSQITPKRQYCVLHQAVKNRVCEYVEIVIKEFFREFSCVQKEYSENVPYLANKPDDTNVDNESTFTKMFDLALSRASKRKRRMLDNRVKERLEKNKKYVNALITLGVPVTKRPGRPSTNIYNKDIIANLYKVHTLNEKVQTFKNIALNNLPRKITKEINKIVRDNHRSEELTESLRAACLEEMLIILDQWNTQFDLIQFADMYIKRTIKERYSAETSAVDKSIDNNKHKASRLIQDYLEKERGKGKFVSLQDAKDWLKSQIKSKVVTGIKVKDVDNYMETSFGTESLDLQMENGFEVSTEMHFEDSVISEGESEYNQVTELLSRLKHRERIVLTKLLSEANNQSESAFRQHIKLCLRDSKHALNADLLSKFENILKEMN